MGLADDIAEWIASHVRSAGAKGTIVGLSGGIDSSVVGGLCRKAVGSAVLGTILPCQSQPIDEEYARIAAATLGIRTEKVDLTPVFETLVGQLPETSRPANANAKSRLRMLTNYYLANLRGYLVVGTGNKTELYIGYFTKYGDGGADILPLGGLLKREVRDLARELGVPQLIVDRTPTAGLWPGQTDEGEIGLSYDDLDDIVDALSHGREPVGKAPEQVERVRRMSAASAHKRATMPIFAPA